VTERALQRSRPPASDPRAAAAVANRDSQSLRSHGAGLFRVRAYIGLGANLGDPVAQLRAALVALDRLPQTCLVTASSFYRSAPVGYAEQPDFYNAVAAIDTALPPQALLAALLDIERAGGRTREFSNAPRTIDLDLLLYGEQVVSEPGLDVPHPRMAERAFVLLPLAEIAPGCRIPGHDPLPALLHAVFGQPVERLAADPDSPAGAGCAADPKRR